MGLETPSAAAPHQRQYLLIITNLIDEQINLSLRVLYCCELVNRENLFFTPASIINSNPSLSGDPGSSGGRSEFSARQPFASIALQNGLVVEP